MYWIFPLTILTTSAFLVSLCFTMITPFLPIYLVHELSVPQSDVNMWSSAVYSITFFISGLLGPVWGAVADRKGLKLMAIRASVCLAIAYSLCGVVRTAEELFFVRFLQGLAAGFLPALFALVSSTVPPQRIGLSMGLIQGGMTIGGIAGPFIGGVLAKYFGMRPSFFVAGITLTFVTLLLIFLIKEPTHKIQQGRIRFFDLSVLRQKSISRLLLCATVIHMSLFAIQPILPLYIAELQGSMEDIALVAGMIFSICGISIMIASPLIGMVGQKYGFHHTLILCLTLSSILIAGQVLADSVEGFTAWRFIAGFAIAGLVPTVNSLLSINAPSKDKGKIFGWNFLCGHVGMAVGPLLAGPISNLWGYSIVIASSGLILLPLAIYLFKHRS